MKKKYLTPDIEIVEFEIKDIITHSIATGGDESGNNDVSHDDGWGDIWFNGTGYSINIGDITLTGGN